MSVCLSFIFRGSHWSHWWTLITFNNREIQIRAAHKNFTLLVSVGRCHDPCLCSWWAPVRSGGCCIKSLSSSHPVTATVRRHEKTQGSNYHKLVQIIFSCPVSNKGSGRMLTVCDAKCAPHCVWLSNSKISEGTAASANFVRETDDSSGLIIDLAIKMIGWWDKVHLETTTAEIS